jgi:hypothetical protein
MRSAKLVYFPTSLLKNQNFAEVIKVWLIFRSLLYGKDPLALSNAWKSFHVVCLAKYLYKRTNELVLYVKMSFPRKLVCQG